MLLPIEIFFSYAHKDEELMNQVRRQLIGFERDGLIVKWHDRKILPGQEWEGIIDERLERAKIILLFISPYFIESKYCYNIEMKEALKRHENGDAIVIPVILRPCLWQNMRFGKLQALPKDGRPITQWGNRDEAALNVAEGIMEVVHNMTEARFSRGIKAEEKIRSKGVARRPNKNIELLAKPSLEVANTHLNKSVGNTFLHEKLPQIVN